MSDVPGDPRRETPNTVEAMVERDLVALGRRSRHRPRPLSRTIREASEDGSRSSWEERLMSMLHIMKKRPRLAGLTAVALAAAAVLLVPISYETVVAQDVSLTLAGSALGRDAVKEVATQFKDALGAEGVQVKAEAADGAVTYALETSLPAGAGRKAETVSRAFAAALRHRGFRADYAVTARKEKVSGNLYAMATRNVIEVDMDGKTDAELEAEITAGLLAAGVESAQVSVTSGDGSMEVRIEAEAYGAGSGPPGAPVDVVLTSGGEPLDGIAQTCRVTVDEEATAAGTATLVTVKDGEKSYHARLENIAELSDGAIAEALRGQLETQGARVSVSVQDGRITVVPMGGDGPDAVEGSSWGGVKKRMKSGN